VTLAFQQVRQTWRMLTLVGLGVLASVLVACSAPLYAQVALTSGLQTVLASDSQSTDIVVRGNAYKVSVASVDQLTQVIGAEFRQHLGPYLLPGQFSLQTAPFNIMAPAANGTLSVTSDQIGMIGTDIAHAAPHLHLVHGRLPVSSTEGATIEVALRSETAASLNWQPGTVIPVRVVYFNAGVGGQQAGTLFLKVVGTFQLSGSDDPFWHGEDFLGSSPDTNNFIASSLASNDALITLFSQAPIGATPVITTPSSLLWYYRLDPARLQVNQLDTVLQAIQTIQVDNANNDHLNQSILQRAQTYLPDDALSQYHDRLPVVQFPVTCLTLLVLCMALFFVTLMTGILIDRQAGALALLRSRGASGWQIFWSMVTQAGMPGLLAIVAGPLLAIPLVRLLAEHLLSGNNQALLASISARPLVSALNISPYALATVGAMMLTMTLAIWSTASRDVLALRRETARSTHRPIWQRLNLDAGALLLALVGAGFALYLTRTNALDTRLRLRLLSPLTLLEALLLLVAAMLLLLRGFPLLLQGAARLATRVRGATSLLALAQMSRAPRQSVRMTLLLALATAFTIFTLIFNATQAQRIQDVADYQAMADFSGSVPVAVITPQQMTSVRQAYNRLPGVLSTSLGFLKFATAGGAALSLPIDFKAVDADTFASTARWSPQNSAASLSTLMGQLVAARALALKQGVVPAIVDAATWDELHLSPGANFTLNFSVVGNFDELNLRAIAEVQHIPTAGNSSIPGVLTDYQTFVRAYTHNFTRSTGYTVPLNYVWLRTTDNPARLLLLRRQLTAGALSLSPLYDRRQMVTQLSHEPLSLALFGILLLGAVTALLLALVGNLVASWLNARARQANFATLRALGATPRQIASTVGWEQVIVYTTAILLGFLFGWLLAMLALPSLVFTSILPNQVTGAVDAQTFYAAQNAPQIAVVMPPELWAVLAILIALCLLALGMMVRVVSRPSIARLLRLNED
jgi:hypothetical protein